MGFCGDVCQRGELLGGKWPGESGLSQTGEIYQGKIHRGFWVFFPFPKNRWLFVWIVGDDQLPLLCDEGIVRMIFDILDSSYWDNA